jgi:predicted O-methyltransferase YrrM
MLEEFKGRIDPSLYEKALSTPGFFAESEADFLIENVLKLSPDGSMLEIGSFFGRSTLFALSALQPEQSMMVVDNFRVAAAYSGHSFQQLKTWVADPRVTILPLTLLEAAPHLQDTEPDIVFIDGDHSFYGVSQDLAISVSLSAIESLIMCHDVCDLFPGVMWATDMFVRAQILEHVETRRSLASFRVRSKPSWLMNPEVFRDTALLPQVSW